MAWSEYENKHAGETCLVIGNGPSLKDLPIRFLQKYPSFGTNRIYLLEGFSPNYYVCVNPLVVEQYLQDIIQVQADAKFITDQFAWRVPNAFPLHSTPVPAFSTRPMDRVYEGFTVTFVCLELAYWMGFKRVLLVGVDHFYRYQGQPNEERVMTEPDPNHFDPSYFEGAKWNNPDLARSESAYHQALTYFTVNGREIVNCTPGTKLEVFPLADWRDYD